MTRPSQSSRRKFLAGITLLACASCSPSGAGSEAPTLYFAAIPDQNRTELESKFRLVAEYLAEELGARVEYVPTTSYAASVEAFVNGDVHLAWFGGVTGVQARRRVNGARAIAQGRVDPEYKSYFIANAAAGIEPSEEFPKALAGRTFTFGSPDSTSGRVMPEFFVRQNTGQAPAEFFATEPNAYSGAHDKTAKLVEAGTFDAGALSYKKYDSMVASGKLDPERCVRIWTTPTYPDYNWTVRPDVDALFESGFTERIQAALVACQDPDVLRALDRPEGLIPAKDGDFAAIAETMQAVGL